jgi:hypothetical protein
MRISSNTTGYQKRQREDLLSYHVSLVLVSPVLVIYPSQARSPNLQLQRASNTYVSTALEFGWVEHDFAATNGGRWLGSYFDILKWMLGEVE